MERYPTVISQGARLTFIKYLKFKHYMSSRKACLLRKQWLLASELQKSIHGLKAITVTIVRVPERKCVRKSENKHNEHAGSVHSKKIRHILDVLDKQGLIT